MTERPTGSTQRFKDEWGDVKAVIQPQTKITSTGKYIVTRWLIRVVDVQAPPGAPPVSSVQITHGDAHAWMVYFTIVRQLTYATFDPNDWRRQHVN